MRVLLAAIVLVVLWGLFNFSGFVADDAFISFRYAENLIDHGALVYNLGEPINAMTSPLHVMLLTALYALTGNTLLAYKVVALAAYFCTALIVWRLFKQHAQIQLLALVLVALPPAVLLWTSGGLETPLLTLVVVCVTAQVYQAGEGQLGRKDLCIILFLSGLGFLLRYDSALFFAPVVGYSLFRAESVRSAVIAFLVGALLPALWLMASYQYYGDIFPTSFYEKAPRLEAFLLKVNAQYIFVYLFVTGIAIAMLVPAVIYSSSRDVVRAYRGAIAKTWWLWLALVVVLLYGLTVATSHMMFSFRFFVPYIPAAAIAILTIYTEADGLTIRKHGFAVLLSMLIVVQAYQHYYTYYHSLNGLAPVGEFRRWGVNEYNIVMAESAATVEVVKDHWRAHGDPTRQPRISTFAVGLLPYIYKEAYIYGLLVSYRHCNPAMGLSSNECGRWGYGEVKKSADYTVLLHPVYGQLRDQLPHPLSSYEVITERQVMFDGGLPTLAVLYNPNPEPHRLSNDIAYFYQGQNR
jgi:hypothetical protein